MLLRSRMHCLSPSDNPNTGSGVGRNGTPPRLLSTKECKKLDNTLWGGPAVQRGGKQFDKTHNFLCCRSLLQGNGIMDPFLKLIGHLLSFLLTGGMSIVVTNLTHQLFILQGAPPYCQKKKKKQSLFINVLRNTIVTSQMSYSTLVHKHQNKQQQKFFLHPQQPNPTN